MDTVVCVATAVNAVAVVVLLVITAFQVQWFRNSVAATTRYNLSVDAQALNRLLVEYPSTHRAFADTEVYRSLGPDERLRADTICEVWLLHYETVFESWPTMSLETRRLYENAIRGSVHHYPLLRKMLHDDAFSGKPVWHVKLREMAG
ncbi:hypothetical protein LLH23_05285 [bacterium]|nr:hypothetical protein [bacterium]